MPAPLQLERLREPTDPAPITTTSLCTRQLSRVPDLQEIVDDLEAEIGRPISVEDRRWRLLAHSAQPDETDPVRQRSILTPRRRRT